MTSLSAHLLEQYYTFHQSRAPFGQPVNRSQLATSGPMSYAPRMHGSFPLQQPFVDQSMTLADTSSFHTDMAESTAQKIATLQAKLDKKLGPEYISQRPGPGGGMKLTYAEGWKIINLANEVFGFNGWSSSVVNLNTDFIDYSEETKRYSVGVSAVIKVTLKDGVSHEDVGYGMLENSKSKGAALDKCKKEAVTDGVKRTLRNFGNLLGNCLYDKQYTQEIVKIKVPPPKFDKSALHRRPEFQEGNSTTTNVPNASTSNASASSSNVNASSKPAAPLIIPKAIGVNSYSNTSASNTSVSNTSKPTDAVPAHIRPNATSTPIRKNTSPQGVSGARKGGIANISQKSQGITSAAILQASDARNATSSSTATPHQTQQANRGLPAKLPSKPAPKQPSEEIHGAPNVSVAPQQKRQEPRALRELERAETYSFDSDDDEFLAALELAEGDSVCNDLAADIGRPIDESEGIGNAIDFDEGLRDAEETDSLLSSSGQKTLVDGNSSDKNAAPQKQIRQNESAARSTAKSACPNAASAHSISSAQSHQAALPAHRGILQPREPPASSVPPARSVEDEIANQIVAIRQRRNAMRKQAAITGSAGGTAGENAPLKAQSAPQSSSKPRTPSMGGFNFPSGMRPDAPATSCARQSQGATVQAGVKRTADAMNAASTGGGLGLSYADAQAAAQARSSRQPFAPLDVPAGGDSKRICR